MAGLNATVWLHEQGFSNFYEEKLMMDGKMKTPFQYAAYVSFFFSHVRFLSSKGHYIRQTVAKQGISKYLISFSNTEKRKLYGNKIVVGAHPLYFSPFSKTILQPCNGSSRKVRIKH